MDRAVRSMGVYCRPTCPSCRPMREHVTCFGRPEEAEQAGYRPCQRCCPGQVSERGNAIADVHHLLETADPTSSLANLGEAVGRSPSHLQRVFKRATGMSPKQYAAALRTERLKAGLKEGRS